MLSLTHTPMASKEVQQAAVNVPILELPTLKDFQAHQSPGALRYQAPLDRGIDLEALLINKQHDTLLVALHGAITRKKITLPMFERLTTFKSTPYSLMIFSDPTLRLADNIELAWYTGWENMDIRPIMADWIIQAAKDIGAKNILIYGGSGGGFAALQVAAYVPGSTCLTVNPQTEIFGYKVEGIHLGPLRRYVNTVWQHLLPVPAKDLTDEDDWHSTLGDRMSVVKKYETPIDARVLYLQNSNDHSHMDRHHGPFKDVIENGPNKGRVEFEYYEGPNAHAGPQTQRIYDALHKANCWF